jgi:opacity protein-like surface antigen
MKLFIFIFLLLFNLNCFAQSIERNSTFSKFHFGFLGGINYSTEIGPSLLIEGSTDLSPQINIKLSFGYSIIYKDEGYTVNTYRYSNFFNLYQTETYTVDKINYYVFPISVGIDYVINLAKFSPYTLLEIGYNFYTYETSTLNWASNTGGSYETYDEIPSEFKNVAPDIPEDNSYTIALGIGTKYKLSSSIDLDLRYLYQFNKSLINTSQILIGIEF